MTTILDNVFWHALTGAQAHFAAGAGPVRRYARGFSPIAGFADPQRPDFAALASHFEPGESFYTDGWSGAVPSGWRIEVESTMYKMIWDGGPAPEAEAPGAVPLGPEHAARAVELATLTRPGPFGPRTIELGDYFGYLEGERLLAMAGERAQAGTLREISGICTHPDHQGLGFAGRLTALVLRRMLQRGETPFLHVMCANDIAHGIYRRVGFRDYKVSVVRVVART